MINFNSVRVRRIALWLSLVLVLPTILFGVRSVGSFRLLRSAYEAGAPKTSSIRGWMTIAYVAGVYHIPATDLRDRLGLPSNVGVDVTLKSAAEQSGVSPYQYVQHVQRIIAAGGSKATTDTASEKSGWFRTLGNEALSALLVYGYPVLGLTVLLGAAGLPLPQGLATLMAGSLAAQGRFNWMAAGGITVAASVLGDVADYGFGLVLGREVLQRYGAWLGFTPARQDRAQSLFTRWGAATVFVTRTFVSYLSSSASLLAGMSRYRWSKFLGVTVVGRLLWTAAYLGLGYVIGADLEAASAFLTNVSAFLVSMLILLLSGVVTWGPSSNVFCSVKVSHL